MKNSFPQLLCIRHSQLFFSEGNKLICSSGCSHPVRDGIPRIIDSNYAVAFGFQWNRFQKTQLDSYTKTNISRKRLSEALGGELLSQIGTFTYLEIGCGAGRFTEVLLEYGSNVASVDMSDAVDANARNFPITDSHSILQADVLKLPFQVNNFDLVLCLGVIQHTPNPENTIFALAQQVKPGGWLVIDHYTKSFAWNLRSARYIRPVLKRLPPALALRFVERTYFISKPFFLFSRNRVYRKLLNILLPVVFFDKEIPELGSEFKDEWSILDSFDSLTDWYKHRRSSAQIRKALENSGLTVEMCQYGGNGVIARAHRDII